MFGFEKISTKTENIWNCNKIKRLINFMWQTKNGCNRIWLHICNTYQWHSMLHIRKSESFVLFQRSKWTKCNYNNSKYWEQTNSKSTKKKLVFIKAPVCIHPFSEPTWMQEARKRARIVKMLPLNLGSQWAYCWWHSSQ